MQQVELVARKHSGSISSDKFYYLELMVGCVTGQISLKYSIHGNVYIFPPITYTRVVIIKLRSINTNVDIQGGDIYRSYLILCKKYIPKIVFHFTSQSGI